MFYSSLILYAPLLSRGLVITIGVWALSALISTTIGIIFGVVSKLPTMIGQICAPPILCFVFLWRAVPLYVQLLIAYFVLPDLLGINLSPIAASIISLSLCSSAYVTTIVRSGISSIPNGQWDAAACAGLNNIQTMRYIIFPQAIRVIAPIMVNEYESLIKSTALLSVLGVPELTKIGKNIIAHYLNPIPVWGIIVLIYLLLSGCLMLLSRMLDGKYSQKPADNI